jgi:ABC-type multidrug transport system fused ATPase/permease subunit
MIMLFLILSGLDLLSIGLVGPFIGMMVDNSMLEKIPWLEKILSMLAGSEPMNQLALLGIMLLGNFIVKGVSAFLVQRRIFRFTYNFRASLISKLMDAYMRMPYSFYLERNSSTIIQSITHHTKVMTDDLVLPFMRLSSDTIMMIVLGSFLLWISPFALLFLATMLGSVILVYILLVKPRVARAGKNVTTTHEQIIRGVNEGIGGIKEIRILGVEHSFYEVVSKEAKIHSGTQVTFLSLLAIPRYLIEVTMVLFVVSYSLYVIFFTNEAARLFSVLAMFGVAGFRLLPALTSISSGIASMNYSSFALGELYKDLKYIEQNSPKKELLDHIKIQIDSALNIIELKNISFHYPKTQKKVLNNLSLKIEAGASIGLIGASGSGKTTLVDLILGLHPFIQGKLLINGAEIDRYGWEKWLRQVAYIPQSVFLVDDTLEKNIAFGLPENEIEEEKIKKAITYAQLDKLVKTFPDGTKTVLGERGIRLSGGERQRIALARAFYHDKNVLILDEATSALDNETEKQITEVINKLHGKKTIIVIAHRLSTVKACDIIYKMQNGKIIKSGTYKEVVENE